jgi:hypothetical protein
MLKLPRGLVVLGCTLHTVGKLDAVLLQKKGVRPMVNKQQKGQYGGRR